MRNFRRALIACLWLALIGQSVAVFAFAATATKDISGGTGIIGRAVPPPIYGITFDDITAVPAKVTALESMVKFPTTRVVFDFGQSAASYLSAIRSFHPHTYIMGLLADATDLPEYTTATAGTHASEFASGLGNLIDIWEIGNEVNGGWLGTGVMAKIEAQFDAIFSAGGITALTFFYEGEPSGQNCIDSTNEGLDMFTWINQRFQLNLPANQRSAESEKMRTNLNYVLISWYPDGCPGVNPDWITLFGTLQSIFPQAAVGFGELGTVDPQNGSVFEINEINTYYLLHNSISGLLPSYVGGYFWWYFAEEMVPWPGTLGNTLNAALAAGP